MNLLKTTYFPFSATLSSTVALSLLMLVLPIQAQDLVFPSDVVDEAIAFPPAPQTSAGSPLSPPASFKTPQMPLADYQAYYQNQAQNQKQFQYPTQYPKQFQYPKQYQYPSQNQIRNLSRKTRNHPRNTNNALSSSNNMPIWNVLSSNNGFNPFNGNMPFTENNFGNPMNNMFGNNFSNNNGQLPFFGNSNSNRKKAWGNKRNIWPDFYTDFTDDAWDTAISGPRKLGRMPGGWRFPQISTPDPVTVSDAITNQFPPIADEAGNMMDFSDWGVFDK